MIDQYKLTILEFLHEHGLQISEKNENEYTCCKLLPTSDRPNRRSRGLIINLSQESNDDRISSDEIKEKLNRGMLNYNPDHDSSWGSVEPEVHRIVI